MGSPGPGLQRLAAASALRRYRKGTLLIQEGEPGGSLYFVEQGLLRAYCSAADGQEFTFGFYGAGEALGELSLDGGPRAASVVVEEAAACRVATREALLQAIAAEPALAFELLALVIRRVRVLSTRARDLALTDAYGRLALLLRAGSLPLPDGTRRMGHALTQAQLAQQIGCSRPMVTRLLGDLVKGGYLRQEHKRWCLLKALPARW